ncbi:hypothetical protein PoB_004463500 [Plakobranchus ocellatus]|uniref:Uncharacterized protein n=1 Tax=Plakobranchus ocellatus TaxID=259542 RepID=A0AAV4BBY1_9GAST|nr:hypothetical protein PoB_004463500 [Plakobranchus ocellatus]
MSDLKLNETLARLFKTADVSPRLKLDRESGRHQPLTASAKRKEHTFAMEVSRSRFLGPSSDQLACGSLVLEPMIKKSVQISGYVR